MKKRYAVDEDVISDIYQESFIALYDNIKEGRLNHLTSSLKTYLFRVGINRICKYQEKGKNMERFEKYDIHTFEDYPVDEWIEMQEKVYEIVNKLEEPCNTVLSLFYWKHKNMQEIAGIMNYKNEQVAKNRKSLCLKTLKGILKNEVNWKVK